MADFESHTFTADEAQVLKIMIHSLYANKEIFVRELISNASDALDKLRIQALGDADLYAGDTDLRIDIVVDKEAKTLTFRDNGIGMTRDEVVTNLGTIAHSGTKKFLSELEESKRQTNGQIGQFGVGFYSSFIVAEKVEVHTLKAGASSDQAVAWSSEGSQEYQLGSCNKTTRGTDITLHLKDEEVEFLEPARLRHVITKYSDHIRWKVSLHLVNDTTSTTDHEGAEGDANKEPAAPEVVNEAQALWLQPKQDISDEDYTEFYKKVALDYEGPLTHAHNKVEGRLEYTTLLFVPKHAPFDIWNPQRARGLRLYVNRVFILDEAEQFLPSYLRFVKGVVDCKDLPLNVSRETLQNNRQVESIRSAITKRVLNMLADLAKNKPDDYAIFWKEFGQVLKEGIMEDASNREALADLLRFTSTKEDNATPSRTLSQYAEERVEGQDAIYYHAADSYAAAKNSPHLEVLKKKNIEVLLLTDRVDEWMVTHLNTYKELPLKSAARGAFETDDSQAVSEELVETWKSTLERVKNHLGDQIKEVRLTQRLSDSPSCLVVDEHDMTRHMAKILGPNAMMGGNNPPILELNPEHPVVQKLKDAQDSVLEAWVDVLHQQAILAEGGQLDDPAAFIKRMNALLLQSA